MGCFGRSKTRRLTTPTLSKAAPFKRVFAFLAAICKVIVASNEAHGRKALKLVINPRQDLKQSKPDDRGLETGPEAQ